MLRDLKSILDEFFLEQLHGIAENPNLFDPKTLNLFLFFLIILSIFVYCFVVFIKTNNIQSLNVFVNLERSISFFIILTSLLLIMWSYLNVIVFNSISTPYTMYTVNKLFLMLFTLTVPVTFVLLIRNERFSTFFCSINFLILLIIVMFLIYTESLLGLVMGYELVFLPSFLIMRKTIYSSSAQSAYSVFTVWSVLGSLVVVSGAVYVVVKTGEHSFTNIQLSFQSWSNVELFLLSFLFFIGFGVKIPIWPFHYWLTRVHVEASTGFSIFLSGFLVKAAVFVCWKAIVGLGLQPLNPVFISLCLFSVLDGVLKLSIQTDIKKLVAFATVFEMGLIYFFLLWKPLQSFTYVFSFCFAHAFLSGLMFFLVDLVYTRTKTRSVDLISGLVVFFPNLSKITWIMLFIFWGLPFTIKFFIELWVLLGVFQTNSITFFLLILTVLAFANIFVTKVWIHLLYGSPLKKNFSEDLNTWELGFSFYLIFFSTIPAILFTNIEV